MRSKKPSKTKLNRQSTESADVRLYGLFSALVSDISDPDGQGRVKVMLQGLADDEGGTHEAWARLAISTGRHLRGSWSIPEVDDEVLVAFEGGDPQSPIIIGGLWNGAADADRYLMQTRNGLRITLDDTGEQEQLILETPNGQRLTMKDGPDSVEIADSNGNTVKLEGGGITVNTPAKATINASLLEVSAGLTHFSGVVQCDTLISNVVVSAVYTPGQGNIW